MYLYVHRVVKQSLRSAGGNLTEKHVEDVSLCALFLMDAAKKTDQEFRCYQSGTHTTRDSDNDIKKMTNNLLESTATRQQEQRTSPGFVDPTDIGVHKLCTTEWIETTISKLETDHLQEGEGIHKDIDLNYELADVN